MYEKVEGVELLSLLHFQTPAFSVFNFRYPYLLKIDIDSWSIYSRNNLLVAVPNSYLSQKGQWYRVQQRVFMLQFFFL